MRWLSRCVFFVDTINIFFPILSPTQVRSCFDTYVLNSSGVLKIFSTLPNKHGCLLQIHPGNKMDFTLKVLGRALRVAKNKYGSLHENTKWDVYYISRLDLALEILCKTKKEAADLFTAIKTSLVRTDNYDFRICFSEAETSSNKKFIGKETAYWGGERSKLRLCSYPALAKHATRSYLYCVRLEWRIFSAKKVESLTSVTEIRDLVNLDPRAFFVSMRRKVLLAKHKKGVALPRLFKVVKSAKRKKRLGVRGLTALELQSLREVPRSNVHTLRTQCTTAGLHLALVNLSSVLGNCVN